MKQIILPLALAAIAAACGDEPRPRKAVPKVNTHEVQDAGEPGLTPEDIAAAEALAAKIEADRLAAVEAKRLADERRRQRAKKMFSEVMVPLNEASAAYDEHEALDDSTWFGKDKEDNMEQINELLDDAMVVLGVSEIATARTNLRRLQKEITALEAQIIEDREARLSAPLEDELGTLQGALKTSREEYDERMIEAQKGIDERHGMIRDLETEFVVEMRAIGVDLDIEGARALLTTVTGDDFVDMCVVFDNVRGVTKQLEELTSASGESLDAAKRYYGSYVVLIRLMDRIQKDFVRRTRDEMIPKLDEYAKKAEEIIRDARQNLKDGGNPEIAKQNIRSNELTIRATGLYGDYLREQAAEIEARNEALQVTLRDAVNTYDTVSLSSQVSAILKEGQRNFAALLKLDLPDLRGFDNSEMKAEFERLTREMTRIN